MAALDEERLEHWVELPVAVLVREVLLEVDIADTAISTRLDEQVEALFPLGKRPFVASCKAERHLSGRRHVQLAERLASLRICKFLAHVAAIDGLPMGRCAVDRTACDA